jgi:hypothetical protein
MNKWTPPNDIDSEVIVLCQAINRMPGVETIESCCGHSTSQKSGDHFGIWMEAKRAEDLLPLLYYIDTCHIKISREWRMEVYTDCSMDEITYHLVGPKTFNAYDEADKIAYKLNAYLDKQETLHA